MSYIAIFVIAPGKTRYSRYINAPRTEWLLEDGKKYGAKFVVRYWPSRKGWRILDMRNVVNIARPNWRVLIWRGHEWSARVYPNEDAAVMHAMMMASPLLT